MVAMASGPDEKVVQTSTLAIVLPDWQRFDTVLRSPLPFVLWQVGDQPLLYHWLDHAVDQGYEKVALICSDRPGEVRRAMEEAQLWPIQWDVEPVAQSDARANAVVLNRLPDEEPPAPAPEDGWGLLQYWYALRKQWFDQMLADEQNQDMRTLAVGRFCTIHPSVVLNMPIWIEDYVQIGPGSVIGPYVNICKGAVIEGPTTIESSMVAAHTYLAGNTELRDCYLEGGLLLNLRHSARVAGIDMVIASSLKGDTRAPPVFERVYAFYLMIVFALLALFSGSGDQKTWESSEGLKLSERTGPLWKRRRGWLANVIAGKLRLFGVLPRTQAQLDGLSEEWRAIIARSPCGVFSYADLLGVHSADDELESVHAVYQATTPDEAMRSVFKENKWKIFRSG
jgi:hypothetical protein